MMRLIRPANLSRSQQLPEIGAVLIVADYFLITMTK
jgi:hypothetical protein